ncbi:hypothetical protein NPIL_639381 [Nephila pilipes]|uniref:Uncharacterized protein n=1 Tax=Nephila pilipes TaxID=299642 RepID=A0A8X6Q8H2_NEPPI|nr:hypothetical protein NPIL_639381 [Nephila pilipes]
MEIYTSLSGFVGSVFGEHYENSEGKDRLVRTVTLKNQSNTLIRSFQRALPPEVSGNDWKSLQLQGVQPTECVKSPNPDSSEVNQARGTKYGRKVKKHVKLNLLTTKDVYEWLSSSSKEKGFDNENGSTSPTNEEQCWLVSNE